jgi:hypothetical protein
MNSTKKRDISKIEDDQEINENTTNGNSNKK